MQGREITKSELEKLRRQQKSIIRTRGEVIHWIVEIEALMDEIICAYFIKPEYFSQVMKILLWENFSISLKIRLFNEIDFGKNLKKVKEQLVKDLNNLNSIRNKMAHGLGIVSLKYRYVVSRESKGMPINEKFISEFRKKSKNVLASLHAILCYRAGIKPENLKDAILKWVMVDKITGHFAEKNKFHPKPLNNFKNNSYRKGQKESSSRTFGKSKKEGRKFD